MSHQNHHPRIYDVPLEELKLKVLAGERVCECCGHRTERKDVWYPISYGELRNVVQDGLDALLRQMRELEKR